MHELLQREQQPGESADDYIHSMQQLASRLKKPMPERQLVKVVKKGLRDGIARYVYAMDVLTVDELREECVEVERTTSTLPGESVPAYRVLLLLSGTSSGRIAALRSIAILSGSRISDCPCTTHRRAPFSRVEIRIAAGLRRGSHPPGLSSPPGPAQQWLKISRN